MLSRTVGFFVAFVLSIAVGRQTVQPETGLALFWPAAGVAALWGVLAERTREVVVVGVLVGVVSGVGNALTGVPPRRRRAPRGRERGHRRRVPRHPLVAAAPGRPRPPRATALTRLSDVYRFFVAAASATALSAVLGMARARPRRDAGHRLGALVAWVVRNLAAIIVIAVPGLAVRDTIHLVTPRRVLEALPLYIVTVALLWVVFGPGHTLPLAFVPFVLLVWSGLRLPLPLAAAEGILVALGTLVLVARLDGGPFGAIADDRSLVMVLQGFMAMATGSSSSSRPSSGSAAGSSTTSGRPCGPPGPRPTTSR